MGRMFEASLEGLAKEYDVALTVLQEKSEVHLAFAKDVAKLIKEAAHNRTPLAFILPVGPIKQYPILAELCNRERISWKHVHVFHMDEYLDWEGRAIPETHPLSFAGFMKHSFYSLLNPELRIPDEQVMFPDPLHIDAFSARIDELGGIDCCYGGIGIHGHVAFNEPPTSRFYQVTTEAFKASKTRILPLAPETIVMNSARAAGGRFEDFPPLAVTVGMKDILESKRIRLYCDGGEWQRTAVRYAVAGEPGVHYPVSLLRDHPDFAICVDRETAEPARYHLG